MTDAASIEARMRQIASSAAGKATMSLGRATIEYVTAVKRDAPVDTGDYRRDISASAVVAAGFRLKASAGTTKPQGPTLEYGDTQPDRLGRARNFAPQPHFEPNLPLWAKALRRELNQRFGK